MLTVVRLQSLRLWASNHWNWLYFLGRLFLLWSEVVPFLKTHHENDNNHRSQEKRKIKTPPIFPHVHTFVFFHRNYFKAFYTTSLGLILQKGNWVKMTVQQCIEKQHKLMSYNDVISAPEKWRNVKLYNDKSRGVFALIFCQQIWTFTTESELLPNF